MNVIIHRILLKNLDFTTMTQKSLDNVIDILNNTPRKILSYKNPMTFRQKIYKVCFTYSLNVLNFVATPS